MLRKPMLEFSFSSVFLRVNTPSLSQALSRAIVAALEEAEPRGLEGVLQTADDGLNTLSADTTTLNWVWLVQFGVPVGMPQQPRPLLHGLGGQCQFLDRETGGFV